MLEIERWGSAYDWFCCGFIRNGALLPSGSSAALLYNPTALAAHFGLSANFFRSDIELTPVNEKKQFNDLEE